MKYLSVKDLWENIPDMQKADTEVKKTNMPFKLPQVPITIGKDTNRNNITMNLFDKVVLILARHHWEIMRKVGFLKLDDLWCNTDNQQIKLWREKKNSEGKSLFDLYPTPFCGRRLYQGHLPLLTVKDYNQFCKVKNKNISDDDCKGCNQITVCHSKVDNKLKKSNVTWNTEERNYKTLGGIVDSFDANKNRIESKDAYKAEIAIDTFDVGVTNTKKTHFENIDGKDVEVEDAPDEKKSFTYIDVVGKLYEPVRKMLLPIDIEINAENAKLAEKDKFQKLDCFFIANDITTFANKKYMTINHIVFITM